MTSRVTRAQAQSVICSNCKSMPNKSCTQPTDNGRRAVQWVHLAREADYLDELDRRKAAAPLT